jgi:ribosomal RNA-processing protein 8
MSTSTSTNHLLATLRKQQQQSKQQYQELQSHTHTQPHGQSRRHSNTYIGSHRHRHRQSHSSNNGTVNNVSKHKNKRSYHMTEAHPDDVNNQHHVNVNININKIINKKKKNLGGNVNANGDNNTTMGVKRQKIYNNDTNNTSSTTIHHDDRVKRRHVHTNQHDAHDVDTDTTVPSQQRKQNIHVHSSSTPNNKNTELRNKLLSGKFRYLNEQLYTTASDEAYHRFHDQHHSNAGVSLFHDYHAGYRLQVDEWPVNPLDIYIQRIHTKCQKTKHHLVIGDFGCGEGRLGDECMVQVKQQQVNNSTDNNAMKIPLIHSFDLLSTAPHIAACNIRHTPLDDNTLDIAIYCLSLMGTDWLSFIHEACRVLKKGKNNGELWITEVKSRFQKNMAKHSKNGEHDYSDYSEFIDAIESIGFACRKIYDRNNVFVMFDFVTSNVKSNSVAKSQRREDQPRSMMNQSNQILKPCLYKKR